MNSMYHKWVIKSMENQDICKQKETLKMLRAGKIFDYSSYCLFTINIFC